MAVAMGNVLAPSSGVICEPFSLVIGIPFDLRINSQLDCLLDPKSTIKPTAQLHPI